MELKRDMGCAPEWKCRYLEEEKTVHEWEDLRAPGKSPGQMEVFQGKAVSLIQGCTHLCQCSSKTKTHESDSGEASNEKSQHKAGLYHSTGVRQVQG